MWLLQVNGKCSDFWSCILISHIQFLPDYYRLEAALHRQPYWNFSLCTYGCRHHCPGTGSKVRAEIYSETKIKHTGKYFSFIQHLYADFTLYFVLATVHSNLLRVGKVSMLTSHEGKLTLRCWQSTQCWSNMKKCWAKMVSIKWCIASSQHLIVHSEGCLRLLYSAGYCRSPPPFTSLLLAIAEHWKRKVLG